MSEWDILRKMTELQLQLILHLPLKNKRRKRIWGNPRPLLDSVPPESIVPRAWCQPCAINHPLSEEGRQAVDTPLRPGGWQFSCPPRLEQPNIPTVTTPTAGLVIRGRPGPVGPWTATTAASPLSPGTHTHSIAPTPDYDMYYISNLLSFLSTSLGRPGLMYLSHLRIDL